jgi:peptidyl-prolyl isomerase D
LPRIGIPDIPSPKVRQIENYPTASGDAPTTPITISACGVLSPDDPSLTENAATDGDAYEDYPDDEDRDVQNPEIALDIAKTVREVGNKLFKQGKIDLALQKYQSEWAQPAFQSRSVP